MKICHNLWITLSKIYSPGLSKLDHRGGSGNPDGLDRRVSTLKSRLSVSRLRIRGAGWDDGRTGRAGHDVMATK